MDTHSHVTLHNAVSAVPDLCRVHEFIVRTTYKLIWVIGQTSCLISNRSGVKLVGILTT